MISSGLSPIRRAFLTAPLILMCVMSHAQPSEKRKAKLQPLVSEAVLRSVIDYRPLSQYFHPKEKDRVPLLVSDHLVSKEINISKFGKRVEILPDAKLKGLPHLRIKSVLYADGAVLVLLDYEAEGVGAFLTLEEIGEAEYEVRGNVWER